MASEGVLAPTRSVRVADGRLQRAVDLSTSIDGSRDPSASVFAPQLRFARTDLAASGLRGIAGVRIQLHPMIEEEVWTTFQAV